MSTLKTLALGVSAILLLEGCASTPAGPTVAVMPAHGKPFEVFAQEQAYCQQYADHQVAGQADDANTRAIGTALIGSALGAGLGAAVGGGHGAGVGAAAGGVVGTGIGASNSQHGQYSIQQQYNNAYVQCMVAKGNQYQPPVQHVVVQPPPTVVYQVPPPPPTVIYQAPPPVVYTQPPVYAQPPVYVAPPPPPQ